MIALTNKNEPPGTYEREAFMSDVSNNPEREETAPQTAQEPKNFPTGKPCEEPSQAAQTVQDWRPIETAPRDGTVIVLLCDYGRYTQPALALFEDTPDKGGDFGKFVWLEVGEGRIAERVPTHWMPLPNVPGKAPALVSDQAASEAPQ